MTTSQGLNIYYEGNSYKDGKIDISVYPLSIINKLIFNQKQISLDCFGNQLKNLWLSLLKNGNHTRTNNIETY